MMTLIHQGIIEVTTTIAQDLVRAAAQYLLQCFKHLCEYSIA
jgi:hypothetical protein